MGMASIPAGGGLVTGFEAYCKDGANPEDGRRPSGRLPPSTCFIF
jgi:hypothetical protein